MKGVGRELESINSDFSETIFQALVSPVVKTILIKGNPGTGKTTLSLELMRRLGGGLYVSTRVSEFKLLSQLPHYGKLFKEGLGEQLIVGSSTLTEVKSSFADIRLATLQQLVEKVLEGVYAKKYPVIILDSFDALASEVDPVERVKIEKALANLVEASQSKLILVSETRDVTSTDYLVDAILYLVLEDYDGYVMRYMRVDKLRGHPIKRRRMIFTLHDGKFRLLANKPEKHPENIPVKRFKSISHCQDYYSTGSEDFDRFLGNGFSKGSWILFETSSNMPQEWFFHLLATIRYNFLSQGCNVVVIPIGGVNPEDVINTAKLYVDEKTTYKNQLVAVYGTKTEDRKKGTFRLTTESIDDVMKKIQNAVTRLKRQNNRPCLILLGIDKLENIFGSQMLLAAIAEYMLRVKEDKDLLILGVKESSLSKQALADMCDIHLKIAELYGSMVMRSVKPPSYSMHVEYDYSNGYPAVKLTPIV